MSKTEKLKVRFLTSPTGRYKLSYNAGDVVELNADLAGAIVDNGDGEIIAKKAPRKKSTPVKVKKPDQ